MPPFDSGERNQPPRQLGWESRLSEKERQPISPIFREVLTESEKNCAEFRQEKIDDHRLAIVVAAWNALDTLPESLKEITAQARTNRLDGEIFVVLNKGGGNTREYLHPHMDAETIARIAREAGVDEIIWGKTIPLSETSENSKTIPREIELEKPIPEERTGLRLIIIEQQNEPDNAGKIRALRDVYHFLKRQNRQTGYCPRYLLAMDAETRLRPVDFYSKRILSEVNSGLGHMIALTEGGKNLVGAKLQFMPYDTHGNPNWQAEVPPMQETASIMHGMKGYEWLPGGATLGSFVDLVSILEPISHLLPGTRVEDALTTVAAKALDIKTIIDQEVVHTNLCPYEEDSKAVFTQMERWLKGDSGMKEVAGQPLSEKVIKSSLLKVLAYPLYQLARGKPVNVPHLITGLRPYIQASKLAIKMPDKFLGGTATFH